MNRPNHETEGVNRTKNMRFYPFVSTGKERDEETGYGYFGARYMDHELTTMWLSVDPMMDKYPSVSPYNYCMWNPVKMVDENGEEPRKPKPLIRYYGNGTFMVNTDNLSNVTRSRIAIANYYGAHGDNNIGVNLTIGQYVSPYVKTSNIPYINPFFFMSQDCIGVDPDHVVRVVPEEGNRKRNGKPYYNKYEWNTCAKGPGTGRVAGGAFLALDILVHAANTYQIAEIYRDNTELKRQIGLLNMAAGLVNKAIESGAIFTEDQASNNDFLGDVINYIYQGSSVSHGGMVSGRKISQDAIKIAEKIKARNNIDYPLISY